MQVLFETMVAGLGFLAVYLLPGYLLAGILRIRRVPAAVSSFAGSFIILAGFGYCYFIGLVRFEQVRTIYYILAGAGFLLFLFRLFGANRRRVEGIWRGVPKSLAITCLAVFLAVVVLAYLKEGKIAGDYLFHITGVRKIAASSLFEPNLMWGRYDFPPFPAYRYPLLHFSIALASGVTSLDAIVISNYLPAFLYILAFFVWYFLALVLTGNRSYALGAAACFYLYTGILQNFATVRYFLVPQHFSDLILSPLLLCLFFLLLRQEGRKRFLAGVALSILATAQLAVHGSHWFYFLFVSLAYLVFSRLFLRERIPWKRLGLFLLLILLLALPLGVGISELARIGPTERYFEIERDMFLNYRFGTAHGAGRIEALGSEDILIINRSIVFYVYNIACVLYVVYLLIRGRFSRLDVLLAATVISLLLVQLNPLAIRLLAPVISFPGLFRMIVIIPVPLFLAAIAVVLGEKIQKKSKLSGWRVLFFLPLVLPYWLLYRHLLIGAYIQNLWKVQWYLMPVIAIGLLVLTVRAVIRSARVRQNTVTARSYRLPASHLWLLLIFFSPLLILRVSNFRASEFSLRQPHAWRWRHDGWVNFVRDNIEPKSLFLASDRLSKFIPIYTDNYSYIGWTPSSPGIERFSWERRYFRKKILGDVRRPQQFEPLEDRQRYELLSGRGIGYLLLSRSETEPEIFKQIAQSSFLERIWDDGRIYIYRVPPPPSDGPGAEARILEELSAYYAEFDNHADVWQSGEGGGDPRAGVWLENREVVERMVISPEEVIQMGFKFYPTSVPTDVTLSVGGEEIEISFDDLSPRSLLLHPRLQPESIRRICGISGYNYPIWVQSSSAGAVLMKVYLDPAKIAQGLEEPNRSGEPPESEDRLPWSKTEGDSREAFEAWFEGYSGGTVEDWINRLGRKVYESERAHSHVGDIEEDPTASGGSARVYRPTDHDPGYMVFGQYGAFPRGFWTACFRLRSGPGNGEKPVAVIDVFNSATGHRLNRREIRWEDLPGDGTYKEICLPFFNNSLSNRWEFRVRAVGGIEFWCDRIDVKPDLMSWFRE